MAVAEIPPVLFRLVSFMQDRPEWSGTATEPLAAMEATDTAPTVIAKMLNEYHATFLRKNDFRYEYCRVRAGRCIVLTSVDSVEGVNSCFGIPAHTVTADAISGYAVRLGHGALESVTYSLRGQGSITPFAFMRSRQGTRYLPMRWK